MITTENTKSSLRIIKHITKIWKDSEEEMCLE